MTPGCLIYVPNLGQIHVGLAATLLDIAENRRIPLGIQFSKDVPHDSNRNKMVKYFLEQTDLEWLLMIDSDIMPPRNILEMIGNNKKVCSALVCAAREGKRVPLALYIDPADGVAEFDPAKMTDGLQRVDAIGTGCILIHRSILENMPKPYFKFEYNADGITCLGEDLYFCKRLREMGEEIWFDARYVCKHFTQQVI